MPSFGGDDANSLALGNCTEKIHAENDVPLSRRARKNVVNGPIAETFYCEVEFE